MARRKTKSDPLFGDPKPPIANGRQIGAALAGLDATARSMESKWGVGRLPEIVSTETAVKFGGVQDALNQLLDAAEDVPSIAAVAGSLQRGWLALDAEATKLGAKPIEPVGWCFKVGSQPAVLARTDADAAAIRAIDPDANIWTLESVGNAIHALMTRDAPKVAEIFDKPAPETLNPSPFNEATGDAIPF